jgi:hypothetical protein
MAVVVAGRFEEDRIQERVAWRLIPAARMSTKAALKEPESRVCHRAERRSSGRRAFQGKSFLVIA